MTSKASPPALMHKSVGVQGCKVLNADEGIVEAFVSGIGNKDSVGDIIQPGAFDQFLKYRKPKGVWSHDWDKPVSKTLDIYEVPAGDARLPLKMQLAGIGGLYVKTQFNLNTQLGRDAYETVKFFGDEAEWSIGYQVHDQEYDKKSKAMLLKTMELFEYSPVLFGANELTSTVSVKVHKAAGGELEFDIEGLDETGKHAVKAAMDVILKEKSITLTEDDDYDEKPWHVEERNGKFCVIKDSDGSNSGCHDTRKEANAQLAALHASEAGKSLEEDVDTKVDASTQENAEMADTPTDGKKGYSVYPNGDLFMVVDDATGEVEKFFTNVDMADLYAAKENAEEVAEMAEAAYEEAEGAAEMAVDGEDEKSEAVETETKDEETEVEVKSDDEEFVTEAKSDDTPETEAKKLDRLFEEAGLIGEKAGRVLSTKNRSAIEVAIKALQDVLEADAPSESTEKEEADADTKDEEAEVEVKEADVVVETPAEEVEVKVDTETETIQIKDTAVVEAADEAEADAEAEAEVVAEAEEILAEGGSEAVTEEEAEVVSEEVADEATEEATDDTEDAEFMRALAEFEEMLSEDI